MTHFPPSDAGWEPAQADPRSQAIFDDRIVVPRVQVDSFTAQLPPAFTAVAIPTEDLFAESFVGGLDAGGFDTASATLAEAVLAVTDSTAYFQIGGLSAGDARKAELLDLIAGLRGGVDGDCLDARPMFYVLALNHWASNPGEEPRDVDVNARPGVSEPPRRVNPRQGDTPRWPVYVIDGAYSEKNAWHDDFGGQIESVPPYGNASDHGTFVASQVAVMAPDSPVRIYATNFVHATSAGPKTDEFAVGVRLREVIDRYLRDIDQEPDAVVNLSLGSYRTYIEGTQEIVSPLTLETQLTRALPLEGLHIVAAGGNEFGHVAGKSDIPYPADDPYVFGIGAGSDAGHGDGLRWVLWEGTIGTDRRRVDPGREWWAPRLNDLAPGVDIVGPNATGGIVTWSGSSFATALYSGYLASHGTVPVARTAESYYPVLIDVT